MKPFLVSLALICLSCGSSKDKSNDDAGSYFVSIAISIADFKAHDKEFSDKYVGIVNKIVGDRFRATDTIGLFLLLNNARVSLDGAFHDISKMQEVDTMINLKEKCLDFLRESKNCYDNYYVKLLPLLKVSGAYESRAVIESISKQISILKYKDSTFVEAYHSFKEKYGIQVD